MEQREADKCTLRPEFRDFIRAGGKSRAIPLAGDRIVQSLELWYAKANPNSGKPEVNLWGKP